MLKTYDEGVMPSNVQLGDGRNWVQKAAHHVPQLLPILTIFWVCSVSGPWADTSQLPSGLVSRDN